MQFKVYTPEEKEKEVELVLKRVCSRVVLAVATPDGNISNGGHLISFNDDGAVVLHKCISRSFGLKLDENGHLITIKE